MEASVSMETSTPSLPKTKFCSTKWWGWGRRGVGRAGSLQRDGEGLMKGGSVCLWVSGLVGACWPVLILGQNFRGLCDVSAAKCQHAVCWYGDDQHFKPFNQRSCCITSPKVCAHLSIHLLCSGVQKLQEHGQQKCCPPQEETEAPSFRQTGTAARLPPRGWDGPDKRGNTFHVFCSVSFYHWCAFAREKKSVFIPVCPANQVNCTNSQKKVVVWVPQPSQSQKQRL